MLTKQIALDYAKDNIHCNALCPGFLRTNMTANLQSQEDALRTIEQKHPLGGTLGSVDDVARACVFLCSEDSSWVTGVGLPVDGGYGLVA
jgi:NAD(P)-dependent dehydrogenase (short-subunit alcohol dehydrogenase family)